MAPRPAALAALKAIARGRLPEALRLVGEGGPSLGWAHAALARALRERGPAAEAGIGEVRAMLARAALAARPAPIDRARFASVVRADHDLTTGLLQRLLLRLLQIAASVRRALAPELGWLQGHPSLPVAVLAAAFLAVVAVVVWRAGRLVPVGMRHAALDGPAQEASATALWRQAVAAWRGGDRLRALRLGRGALLTRLERQGAISVQPGLSDRELERRWPEPTRAEFHRFRVQYARARWAAEAVAAEAAWHHLSSLWERSS
jgi:hypothetical protein